MRFRTKLFVLMLLCSILPMVMLRAFGIHNVRSMAQEMSQEVHARSFASAQSDMEAWLVNARLALNAEREKISLALAQLAATIAAGDFLPPGEPIMATGGRTGRLCVTLPEAGAGAGKRRREPAWLPVAERAMESSALELGEAILSQQVADRDGVAAAYPCPSPGLRAADIAREPWFEDAFSDTPFSWSRPRRASPQGGWTVNASMVLEDGDERPQGVASATLALEPLLNPIVSFIQRPEGSQLFVCMLDRDAESGRVGLRILGAVGAPTESSGDWLPLPPSETAEEILDDIARHASRLLRAPYAGQDALWAWAPLPSQGAALVMVAPVADLLERVRPVQSALRQRVANIAGVTAGFLAALALINSALVFFLARKVTGPLNAVCSAAEKLAAGDFDVRVPTAARDELGTLGRVFNRVGPQLKEHFRVREALQAAVEIQQSLLPRNPPAVPGLDVHALSVYSDKIGGDYHDYLCVREAGRERFCAVVGDVSDHGIPSAITMATARAFLRLRASLPGELAEIIADVNRKLAEDVEYSGQFMTLFLARIDRSALRVEWVRAGHDPAILFDPRAGAFRELAGKAGSPLGALAESRFEASEAPIAPGQIIVIGTDGVWEARDSSGEMFGKERIMRLVRRHAGDPARDIAIAILDAVEEFRASESQADDVTVMVIKVLS